MLKKTVTYKDFNGESHTEDLYFHLSKTELIELEVSQRDGLSESLQRMLATEDLKTILIEFKNIILTAYGKRSEDGARFIKNQAQREEFESSPAYDAFFMALATDPDFQIEFVKGILPADVAEEAAKAQAAAVLSAAPKPSPPTADELVDLMNEEEREKLRQKLSEPTQ